jgi:hypothetical protein
LYTGAQAPAKEFYRHIGFRLGEQDVLGKRLKVDTLLG